LGNVFSLEQEQLCSQKIACVPLGTWLCFSGKKKKQLVFFEKMVSFLGLDQHLCLKEKHFPKGEHKHFLMNMAAFFWNMVS
jgi:hypothetical protein